MATIHTIGRFSAHADRDELPSWYRRIKGHQRTLLVHEEEDVMKYFAQHLDDIEVYIPAIAKELTL